jgi:Copper type II ascorbate-dependent monooxygenase, C-terminal domain
LATLGGYSTKEEMCLSFITYYPKIDLGEFLIAQISELEIFQKFVTL